MSLSSNRCSRAGTSGCREACLKSRSFRLQIQWQRRLLTIPLGINVDERGESRAVGGYGGGQGFGSSKRSRAPQPGGARGGRGAVRQPQRPRPPDDPNQVSSRSRGHTGRRGLDGAVSDAASGSGGDPHASILRTQILAATEWRQLTNLLTRGAQGPADPPPPPTPGHQHHSADVSGSPATEPGAAAAASSRQLAEADLLCVLWRLVCSHPELQSHGHRALWRALLRGPPPPPSPGPPSADQWGPHPSWPGAVLGAASPLGLQPAAAATTIGREPGARRSGASPGSPAGDPALDRSTGEVWFRSSSSWAPPLAGSGVARRRCLEAVAAVAKRLAPGMSSGGLVTALQLLGRWAAVVPEEVGRGSGAAASEVWRLAEPFLEAAAGGCTAGAGAASAAAATAPSGQWSSAEQLALVAVLPSLHRHCSWRSHGPDLGAPASSRSSSTNSSGGHRGRAWGNGDSGGGEAVGEPSSPPLTHVALAAALASLAGRARLVMPSPAELSVCTAAASACGYRPPREWLDLLKSELRNQLFLLTPVQGAVILASLEQLQLQAGAVTERISGTEARAGGEALEGGLPEDWVATLWEEVQGKAAALELSGLMDSLQELHSYLDSGVLPTAAWVGKANTAVAAAAPPRAPGRRQRQQQQQQRQQQQVQPSAGGYGTADESLRGPGRVRQLAAALLGQLPPQLQGYSAGQLTVVLTAAAALSEYDPGIMIGAPRPGSAAQQPQLGQDPGLSGLHSLPELAARALLARVRTGGFTLQQLGACAASLAELLAAAPPPPPLPQQQQQRPDAASCPATAARDGAGETPAESPLPPSAGPASGPGEPAAAFASVATLILELPGQVPDIVAAGALGPEVLAWLSPLETSLVRMEEALGPGAPLSVLPLSQDRQPASAGLGVGDKATAAAAPDAAEAGSRGLAARVTMHLLEGSERLNAEQLLQLLAAVQHPWTSGLFSEDGRRKVLLAFLDTSVPSASLPRGGPRPPRAEFPLAAAAAVVLPGAVQSLCLEALVDVLCAAARRQTRFDHHSMGEHQPHQRRHKPPPPQQLQLAADPVAAAVLSAALARLLDLATPEWQPGFMDAPERPATALLSPGRWCKAVAALSQAAHALAPTPPGAPPKADPLGEAESSAATGTSARAGGPAGLALTPVTLLQLMDALRTVWPSLSPAQTISMFAHLAQLHEQAHEFGAPQKEKRGSAMAPGAAREASSSSSSPAFSQQRSAGPLGRGPGPAAADWHVAQCAVAAVAPALTPRELAAAVVAAARLAAAVPVCDEWMEALTQVLLSPPPAPAPLAGGLAGLDARCSFELLRGCVELKAVAVDQDGVMLPVLPLLQQLGAALSAALPQRPGAGGTITAEGGVPEDPHIGPDPAAVDSAVDPEVSCSEVCRLLPRLALLASDPALAAVIGTSALPLLTFLERRAFHGTRLGDQLALLQGLQRLLLRPESTWAEALCSATLPLLRNPAAALPDLAALAHAMAAAWVMPTAEWHAAFMAATAERMARSAAAAAASGGGASAAGGAKRDMALEQVLWAQALWSRLSAGGSGGSGGGGGPGLQAPAGWLDLVAAVSVPLLPTAQPHALANLPYIFNSLGHDPGPEFIAALLQGCTAAMPLFSGPQLSRLAQGLAGQGYQPEDPWVDALQLAAAQSMDKCDAQELADLLEGMLLLEEGRTGDQEGQRPGRPTTAGDGADDVSDADAETVVFTDLDLDQIMDFDLPTIELFLVSFWEASAMHLSRDAVLLAEAVARRARRQDLRMVEQLKSEFRQRTNDPQVGPFWRYWTEEVPLLDPSMLVPDDAVAEELDDLSEPLFDGPSTDAETLPRLQRFLAWSALRTGELPEPLPEGVSPGAGLLAARCVELLGGSRAASAMTPPGEAYDGAAAAASGGAPFVGSTAGEGTAQAQQTQEQQQPYERLQSVRRGPGGQVRVAPPAVWVSVLLANQAGAMLLGAGGLARRRPLLRAAQVAAAWGAPPLAEWCEAFLRASRTVFLGGGGEDGRGSRGGGDPDGAGNQAETSGADSSAVGVSGVEAAAATAPVIEAAGAPAADGARVGSNGGAGTGDGPHSGSERLDTPGLNEAGEGLKAEGASSDASFGSSSSGGDGSKAAAEAPLQLGELLQLLLATVALDLAPGRGWLQAAEATSLPLLLPYCPAEEAIALALALQRLGHRPGRRWAAALLAATRPIPARRTALPAVSVAALLVCLADLRIRPADEWLDDALAVLHRRQGELDATLRARLLGALASLEVQPSPEWLAPVVDSFWEGLDELLLLADNVTPLVDGLGALSELDVPVKQSHLSALLSLLSRRLGIEAGGESGRSGAPAGVAIATAAADVARVLICLAGMRRATPSRSNRNTLDAVFTATAERLPVSGPLTPKLLDSWDKLVPV